MWEPYKKGFRAWLQLEKSLSAHSVAAYLADVDKLTQYLQAEGIQKNPADITTAELETFVHWVAGLGMMPTTQARLISGLRQFYKYCFAEEISRTDPTTLLEPPKLRRNLPDVLSYEEVEQVIAAIDQSTSEGGRNKAILETMYSCGLRVSEVVGLKISCLYTDAGFIRVIGKGDKERLVPIGATAIKHIDLYRRHIRVHVPVKPGHEDILFLNRRGAPPFAGYGVSGDQRPGPESRYKKKYFAAYLPAFLCYTPGGKRGRSARRAGNAGARKHYHYRNLHPPRSRFPAQNHGAVSPGV